jgi:hypothetical protein
MAVSITPAELAQEFQVSTDFILEKAATGEWPSHNLGPKTIRFTEADIAAILDLTARLRPVPVSRGSRSKSIAALLDRAV